jgi:hypothetical protein
MNIKELIEHLNGYDPEDIIAYDLWSVEDVTQDGNHYQDYGDVTQEQAEEVLRRMDHHKDCNVGLNWDVMNYHLDNVMSEAAKGGAAL